MKCIICGRPVSYGDCTEEEQPGYPSDKYGKAQYDEQGPVHEVCDLKRALGQSQSILREVRDFIMTGPHPDDEAKMVNKISMVLPKVKP